MAAPAIRITMQRLHSAGLCVTLTPEKGIKVSPANAITDALRELIVAYKVGVVDFLTESANDPAPNHDRPNTTDMKAEEVDRFTARLARFIGKGVTQADAESLGHKLVIRDREQDDRVLCLECSHLQRNGRCGNWTRAGVAIHTKDAQLATDFLQLLHRCDGYAGSQL
jgi:hypothetical protein